MKILSVMCFIFSILILFGGDAQALYSGAHIVGATVSAVIGIFLWNSRSDVTTGTNGCWWIPLWIILGFTLYLVVTGGGSL